MSSSGRAGGGGGPGNTLSTPRVFACHGATIPGLRFRRPAEATVPRTATRPHRPVGAWWRAGATVQAAEYMLGNTSLRSVRPPAVGGSHLPSVIVVEGAAETLARAGTSGSVESQVIWAMERSEG